MKTTIVVLHHGLWVPVLEEAVAALEAEQGGSLRIREETIDTRQFAGEGDSFSWDAAHTEVWRRAAELKELLAKNPEGKLAYFGGGPEVPLAIALGAYLGEQLDIDIHEKQDGGSWQWPEEDGTLELEVVGAPQDRQTTAGPVTLRIELSSRIEEPLMRDFVPETDEVANIVIRPKGVESQVRSLVRSRRDLQTVRERTREALAAVINNRPHVTAVHLFVSGPPSACVVIGQELRLRNMPQVETYRFRRTSDNQPNYASAIRLRAAGPSPAELALTEEEQKLAEELRTTVWEAALRDVEGYSAERRARAKRSRWYDGLVLGDELASLEPFPGLPPIFEVLPERSKVDPVSMESPAQYGYQGDTQVWRVNDRFLIELWKAMGGGTDVTAVRRLVRLFMFHEALHVAHGITKAKVEEVGKFANGLEHVDYTADLYAILHELDRWSALAPVDYAKDFQALKERIAELIDVVVRSFWAFEAPETLDWMEIRRIRRYLNWYWQWQRVLRSRNPAQLAALLARKPIVEIAGLDPFAESRRYYGSLRRFDRRVGLEIAVVLDDEELKRVASSVTVPIERLVAAFREKDHAEIQMFFRKLFDEISEKRALPAV